MDGATQSTIMQGDYGRVTLNLTARSLVEHAHSECNFIFKVGGGNASFRIAGQTHALDDDRAILINSWEPHAKLVSEGGPTLALTVLLAMPWLASTLGSALLPRSRLFPQASVALTDEVREQVARLAMAMTGGVQSGDDEREPLLRDLVRSVVRTYGDEEFTRQSFVAERPMDARIARAIRLMREQAAHNPSLEDLASRVGLSRSRFFEQFKNCVGASPQQYLDWERMALATRRLADHQVSVAEISFELGFSAPSHFARFFSQHIGLPPSDFRRGMLGGAGDAAEPLSGDS